MTIHVKCNGKVFCEAETHEKPFVTLELSYEAAKALKYVVGMVVGDWVGQRQYTSAIYKSLAAINTEDYEDVVSGELKFIDTPAVNKDGWIEWDGGECPVDIYAKVKFRWRDDTIGTEIAKYLRWYHNNDGGDILSYRVLK